MVQKTSGKTHVNYWCIRANISREVQESGKHLYIVTGRLQKRDILTKDFKLYFF